MMYSATSASLRRPRVVNFVPAGRNSRHHVALCIGWQKLAGDTINVGNITSTLKPAAPLAPSPLCSSTLPSRYVDFLTPLRCHGHVGPTADLRGKAAWWQTSCCAQREGMHPYAHKAVHRGLPESLRSAHFGRLCLAVWTRGLHLCLPDSIPRRGEPLFCNIMPWAIGPDHALAFVPSLGQTRWLSGIAVSGRKGSSEGDEVRMTWLPKLRNKINRASKIARTTHFSLLCTMPPEIALQGQATTNSFGQQQALQPPSGHS